MSKKEWKCYTKECDQVSNAAKVYGVKLVLDTEKAKNLYNKLGKLMKPAKEFQGTIEIEPHWGQKTQNGYVLYVRRRDPV